MEIYGFDVSHWNENRVNDIENKVAVLGPDNRTAQFLIAKASEGRTYEDPYYATWLLTAARLGIPFGAYHYARAEKNSAQVEAAHFADVLESNPRMLKIVPVLDFEGNSLRIPNPGQWCAEFAATFRKITGCTPMLYISAAELSAKYNPAALEGMGIWIANWTDKKYKSFPFQFIAMKQYAGGKTSKSGLDENIFYGTAQQFTAYGFIPKDDEDGDEDDTACGCGCECCMPTEV